MLIETDSPFLAPVPHRGKTGEPAFVADTCRFLAELRGEVAKPLQLIRTYLENPDVAALGTARAAFEQIEMFLQSFLLQIRSED